MANFDNHENFQSTVFEDFTCFRMWRFQKSQNQSSNHLCITILPFASLSVCVENNSRSNDRKEIGRKLRYQKSYWKQAYWISQFYFQNFRSYSKFWNFFTGRNSYKWTKMRIILNYSFLNLKVFFIAAIINYNKLFVHVRHCSSRRRKAP